MALRYPLNHDAGDKPFILFTSHRAKYTTAFKSDSGAVKEIHKNDSGSCAMYMPQGFQVSDTMRYESAAGGLAGGVIENVINENSDYSLDDVVNVASTGVASATTALAGLIGNAVGGPAGAFAAGTGGASVGTALEAIRSKKMQNTLNPQEFMLFRAPGMRAFSFTFSMIPSSQTEAEQVTKIIKFFRTKMYPTLDAKALMYNFPEVFNVSFHNVQGIPKIAEAALTNASTTFNPNSMSYFKRSQTPVEIGLTLSFQELMPLSQKNIIEDDF